MYGLALVSNIYIFLYWICFLKVKKYLQYKKYSILNRMFCLGLKRLYGATPVQVDLMKLLRNTYILYKGVSSNNIYTFERVDPPAGSASTSDRQSSSSSSSGSSGGKRRHSGSSSGSSSKHHKRSLWLITLLYNKVITW